MQTSSTATPVLKIEGRSGCDIRVLQIENKILVRKISSSLTYNSRLIKQAKKQSEFKQLNSLFFFDCPAILFQGMTNEGLNYFDMEYIAAEKFSSFLCRTSVAQIQQIVEYIIKYLDYLFESAQSIDSPINIIEKKINDLKTVLYFNQNFSKEFVQDVFYFLETTIPKDKLYQGSCHGDFTFSNMLFSSNGKINLIDFLDSFIESPIVDLVKLRQDSKFFWSVMVDSDLEKFNSCKVMQILSYIDQALEKYLLTKGENVYNWYLYLELFNLVRIMPYVSKENEIKFLDKHIKKIINNK